MLGLFGKLIPFVIPNIDTFIQLGLYKDILTLYISLEFLFPFLFMGKLMKNQQVCLNIFYQSYNFKKWSINLYHNFDNLIFSILKAKKSLVSSFLCLLLLY